MSLGSPTGRAERERQVWDRLLKGRRFAEKYAMGMSALRAANYSYQENRIFAWGKQFMCKHPEFARNEGDE